MLLVVMQLVVVVGVLSWGGIVLTVDRQRVSNAADLAALAGAQAMRDPVPRDIVNVPAWRAEHACGRAGVIAGANGALLTSCALDGPDVVVTAARQPAPLVETALGWLGHRLPLVRQVARAGP